MSKRRRKRSKLPSASLSTGDIYDHAMQSDQDVLKPHTDDEGEYFLQNQTFPGDSNIPQYFAREQKVVKMRKERDKILFAHNNFVQYSKSGNSKEKKLFHSSNSSDFESHYQAILLETGQQKKAKLKKKSSTKNNWIAATEEKMLPHKLRSHPQTSTPKKFDSANFRAINLNKNNNNDDKKNLKLKEKQEVEQKEEKSFLQINRKTVPNGKFSQKPRGDFGAFQSTSIKQNTAHTDTSTKRRNKSNEITSDHPRQNSNRKRVTPNVEAQKQLNNNPVKNDLCNIDSPINNTHKVVSHNANFHEVEFPKVDSHEVDFHRINLPEVGPHKIDSHKTDSHEVDFQEIDSHQSDSLKVDSHKVGFQEDDFHKDNSIENQSEKLKQNKIESGVLFGKSGNDDDYEAQPNAENGFEQLSASEKSVQLIADDVPSLELNSNEYSQNIIHYILSNMEHLKNADDGELEKLEETARKPGLIQASASHEKSELSDGSTQRSLETSSSNLMLSTNIENTDFEKVFLTIHEASESSQLAQDGFGHGMPPLKKTEKQSIINNDNHKKNNREAHKVEKLIAAQQKKKTPKRKQDAFLRKQNKESATLSNPTEETSNLTRNNQFCGKNSEEKKEQFFIQAQNAEENASRSPTLNDFKAVTSIQTEKKQSLTKVEDSSSTLNQSFGHVTDVHLSKNGNMKRVITISMPMPSTENTFSL